MNYIALTTGFVALLLASSLMVTAQKAWEKPFTSWSEEEAKKVLNSSPWVRSYQSGEGLASAESEQIGRERSDQNLRRQTALGSSTRNLGPSPVTIRLHSALPVRQAIVRLHQIGAQYDKMDAKKKSEFDASTKNLLDCPLCRDYYIVTLSKAANLAEQGVGEGLFQTMKLEDLQGNVWLVNDSGVKRELYQFTPPMNSKDVAVFFFERDKESKWISPSTKSFKFVFNNSFFGGRNAYSGILPRNFEFEVPKMMSDGKPIF